MMAKMISSCPDTPNRITTDSVLTVHFTTDCNIINAVKSVTFYYTYLRKLLKQKQLQNTKFTNIINLYLIKL